MVTAEKAAALNGLSNNVDSIWTAEDQTYLDRCIAAIPELQSHDC